MAAVVAAGVRDHRQRPADLPAGVGGHRDLHRRRLRRRLRQRRRPRLLLHGVRAGGDHRAGRQDPAADHGGTHQPARRRVADRGAGRHDIGTYLDLAAAFAGDTTPDVTAEIATRLAYVHGAIADPKERDAFAAWLRATFRPALDAIGEAPRPGDSDDVLTRRGELWQLLGLTAGDTALQARPAPSPRATSPTRRRCRRRSSRRCCRWPPPAVTPRSTTATWPRRKRQSARRSSTTVCSTRSPASGTPALADRTLAFALSPEVRSQDAPMLLGQLLNSGAQDKTWAALSSQWDARRRSAWATSRPCPTSSARWAASAPPSAPPRSARSSRPTRCPPRPAACQQALERIDACVALDQRQSAPFAAWLAARPRARLAFGSLERLR